MFERFTSPARHVVVLAQEEARLLNHNFIGSEHILLGLLGEPDSIAGRVLYSFGMSRDSARQGVEAIVSKGKKEPSGHIPFTPRAKKTLELSLREALQLHHNYIGTEHILLGLIREGDGVGAQLMRQHADLLAIRLAVLDNAPAGRTEQSNLRRWLRRRPFEETEEVGGEAEQTTLSATPAADTTLSEAARLAGSQPVGSHHLLLAALGDRSTAAARALAALGVDLDHAKEALRTVDVAGTSDEQPEEAGRRQMIVRVDDQRVTVEAADPVIMAAARSALQALGDKADPPGTIPGHLPDSASLAAVWQALQESFDAIQRRASAAKEPGDPQDPNKPGTEAA